MKQIKVLLVIVILWSMLTACTAVPTPTPDTFWYNTPEIQSTNEVGITPEETASMTRTATAVNTPTPTPTVYIYDGVEICDKTVLGNPCKTYLVNKPCINLVPDNWSNKTESLLIKGSYRGKYMVVFYDDSYCTPEEFLVGYSDNVYNMGEFNNLASSFRIVEFSPRERSAISILDETDVPPPTGTPTPTDTPEPTATYTHTPEPTFTNTPEPTPTNTPEPTATYTDVPTNTPDPTATPVPTQVPTNEPTIAPTDRPTDEPKPTKTPRPTKTPKPTKTPCNNGDGEGSDGDHDDGDGAEGCDSSDNGNDDETSVTFLDLIFLSLGL